MSLPPKPASLWVFTFKEGLLSRVAHDLRLHVARFEVRLEDGVIRAHFDPASLRVDGAMPRGAETPVPLSSGDHAKIEATIRDEVLRTSHHPDIRFEGRADPAPDGPIRVTGTLRLVGREQPLSLTLEQHGEGFCGRVPLVPSRFGIRPYRALAGALKLRDRVEVEIDLAAPDDPSAPTTWSAVGDQPRGP